MVLKAAGASEAQVAQVEAVEELVDAIAKATNLIEPELLAEVGEAVLDDSARATLGHLISKATKEAPSMPESIDKADLAPEVAAYVESLEAERDQAVAKAAALDTPSDDPEADALQKALDGLPEPLRKAWEKQRSDLAEATAVAKAERDRRVDAEYVEKARKDYGDLAIGKPEEFGAVLRKVAEFDATVFVEVDRVLKAAAAQVAEGNLFKSIGAPASIVESGSARERLESLAKAAVSADTTGNLTFAMALAKAAEENPDLYEAHRRESLNPGQEG